MDLNNLKSDPIIIVGGGFGGLSTLQALQAESAVTPIILIDQSPRFIFKPLMYELLSGELQLWEVAPRYSSLASELGFIFLQDCVVQIDEIARTLFTSSGKKLKYSQLVLSTGVTTDYPVVGNIEKYACGFSNLNDILKIKELITKINNYPDNDKPLVIAGAGPTGVELACKAADLLNNRVQIYLVDKGNEILSKSKSFNREKAMEAISKRNIKIYLGHCIKFANQTSLGLLTVDKETNQDLEINYSGLVWTAGLRPNHIEFESHSIDKKKKIKVDKFLQINENKNIFFIGDITHFEDNPYPASAQVSMQQGFLTAQNIISIREGNQTRPFEFVDLGEMLSLGIGNASITGFGITLAGPLAFEIRWFTYLMRMPGFSQSMKSTGAWLFSKKIINRLFSQYP